jgi:F0F1-type ATP synthase epsilon subunit
MNGGTLTILADGLISVAGLNAGEAEKELAAANADASKRGTMDARTNAEHRQRLAYARVALARSSGRR